ncbi:hypothetical protein [Lentzea sp. NBRC 102530]|uniref:hypothetical protein n=1 Tax=Lentzea sp. NBRC 102530 TaxID=3032201 RepID=UPI0024A2E62F|nr:hypothetical protein [Lentzea sp. NBRC 102530]GLY53003.1 hypothetical protein Lesp01_66590 [Lentzea sp. NBRC 102530]
MFPLDEKTIERVARIAVDQGGPYERTGRELEALLRSSGWKNAPEYDHSARVGWMIESLSERDSDDVERLLRRLSDPIEYEDGLSTADAIRLELNRVLEPEQLEIRYVAGRPVMAEVGQAGPSKVVLHLDEVEQRVRRWISDEQLVTLLVDRVRQSQEADAVGSHLLALFGIGSFVEGLLYGVLIERHPECATDGFIGRDGRKIAAKRAGLDLLITVAHDCGLIQLDAKSFMDQVRDFRNYIHPRRQLETGFTPDEDTVLMSWPPVQALLNDLDAAMPAED